MTKQKGVIVKFLTSRSSLVFYIIIIVFFIVSFLFAKSYYKNYRFKEEVAEMTKEIQKIDNENADLKALLQKVKSPAYIEQVARKNFGYVKEGENQIILVDDGGKTSGQPKNDVVKSTRLSNPREWWNYFFNHN